MQGIVIREGVVIRLDPTKVNVLYVIHQSYKHESKIILSHAKKEIDICLD